MLSRIEELALIARCVTADDHSAFGRLVEAYQPQLRRFLQNLAHGDESLASDIAQETFIKAYIGLRSYHGISGFKTWLYSIAYNEYISYKRKSRNMCDIDAVIDMPTENHHDLSDVRMDVESCLRALTDAERTVVLLFYMEDQPINKISAIMGMPNGTVKSHLARARKKMASVMLRKRLRE